MPHYPILARDVVRHVGDAIAFVVADTLEQAKDAAEAIAVDWQPLPHVIGAIAALKQGAPQVWPDRPGNRRLRDHRRRRGRDERPSPRRAKVSSSRSSTSGSSPTTWIRAASSPNTTASRYTLTLGSQGSHIIRDIIAGDVLEAAAGQDARHHAGCRRRLRHQAVSLSRICARRGRRRSACASR